MDNKKIQEIINSVDIEQLKKDAIFGMYWYGGGGDESFIKANKQGVALYALKLLETASKFDIDEQNKDGIILDVDDWVDEDSRTLISYVQPIFHKREQRKNVDKTESTFIRNIQEKAKMYGCFIVVLLLIISTFVGLGTIYHWFFK